MPSLSRRALLKLGGAGALLAAGPGARLFAAESAAAPALPLLGRVRPRRSVDVTASPLSVGFEVLDRKLYDPTRCYPHLAELGVKWARCQTGWARTETTKGQCDFRWLDDIVDGLRKIGIQPWFNLGYGNRLYTPDSTDPYAVGWVPVFDAAAREAWLAYTRAIAEHFRNRVTHWEIWNEPNITNFWKPGKPDAALYVDLLKATVPEIRKRIPNATIIGGAYAGIPMSYVKECLEKGMGEHVDRISYHPYRPMPESNYDKEIAALRELIAGHGKEIKLWQGENGCPSQKGGAGALANQEWNEERQAKWLTRRILCDLRLGLDLTSYFLAVDLVGYRGSTNWKGLLRGSEYTPKPAYFAYQCLCALFDAGTRRVETPVQLTTDGTDRPLFAAAFERAGKPLVALWAAADLLKEWAPPTGTLVLPKGAAALPDPILVDPMTQRAYRLPVERKGEDLSAAVAIRDYPLFVTDRSAVELVA